MLEVRAAVGRYGKRDPVEAELELGGSIEVSTEGETNPVPLGRIKMQAIKYETTLNGRNLVRMVPGKPLDDPEFSIPGVGGYTRGTYRFAVNFNPKDGFHHGPPQVVQIEPGRTRKVIVRKIPLANCSGRIIDATTGEGIPKLTVRLKGTEKWHGTNSAFTGHMFSEIDLGRTDAEGKYSIPCRGNHVYTIAFGERSENRTENEFPYWDAARQKWIPVVAHIAIADGEKARFPDVALLPGRVITGMVCDDSGKVLDGPYHVYCTGQSDSQPNPPQIDQGQFTLPRVNPAMPLKSFIRKGKAVNLVSPLPVDRLGQTLDFTISEKNLVSCIGKIVDAKGHPIPNASVTLIWLPDYEKALLRRSTYPAEKGRPIETVQTDDRGRFSIAGLWHDERYRLRVEAKGYSTAAPEWSFFTGSSDEGSETIDNGEFRLSELQPKN